jgi:Na+/proline symporter
VLLVSKPLPLLRPYINPKANGRQMIFISRAVVIAYGLLSGVLAILLLKIGLSLGWVYLFMGVCVGSAVVPIAFSITWAKCSGKAAVCGAIGGLAGAVIAWCEPGRKLGLEGPWHARGSNRLGPWHSRGCRKPHPPPRRMCTAQGLYGKITIATLGTDYAMLAGNLVAILFSGLICVVMSYMSPQNYNWAEMRDIPLGGWPLKSAVGFGLRTGASGAAPTAPHSPRFELCCTCWEPPKERAEPKGLN